MSSLALLPSNAVESDGDHVFTTSLMVAEIFGKEHKHVLRDIDALDCSAEFRRSNFGPSFRTTETGGGAAREFRYFEMTKDGFTFLVMGYTGAKAAQFKEAYILRFNAMEAALRFPRAGAQPRPELADPDPSHEGYAVLDAILGAHPHLTLAEP